ncbi:MAG: DUF1592 domain-containing protein [Myxococcota bacterium]|nr:DUF1592 domain-containing protein [Myxococcota bacterium]
MTRVALLCLLLCGCEGMIADGAAGPRPAAEVETEPCTTCVGASPLGRLTRLEYVQTLGVAFGPVVDGIPTDTLPEDGAVGPFASNAAPVNVDTLESYQDFAEDAATVLAADVGCADRACVESLIESAGSRLYRGHISAEESAALLGLFDRAESPERGLWLVLSAMLQMPRLMYQIEVGSLVDVDGDVRALTGREIAQRLAYFLWGRPADQPLIDAAEAGELGTPEGIAVQARRLLADDRSELAIADFHRRWLGLDELVDHPRDDERYPGVDELRADMVAETEAFTIAIVRGAGTFDELLTAPYTFASDELAAFYGAPAGEPTGSSALPRVELDPSQRVGLLTQAAVIGSNTTEEGSRAAHRASFLLDRFLCEPLGAPPVLDDIPTPPEGLSTRETFAAKTASPGCQTCHSVLNPLGFLLEHYDASGRYLELDGDHPIDASGALPRGAPGSLDGARDLAVALSESESVHRCVTRQWFRFALGREETSHDAASLEHVLETYRDAGYELEALIVALVQSPAFRLRRVP